MPNRIRKESTPTPPKNQRPSHLRLVTRHSHIARSKKQHSYVVWAFLAIFVATLSTIFIMNAKEMNPGTSLQSSFLSLRSALTDDGILRFQTEKTLLRDKVKKALRETSSETEENIATNIAVYLFPDLLADTDFEKAVALEFWAPMQDAIEKKPKSMESRVWFEEMRANIWNYESPDRTNPRLSDYAKEVLRIYDELSAP